MLEARTNVEKTRMKEQSKLLQFLQTHQSAAACSCAAWKKQKVGLSEQRKQETELRKGKHRRVQIYSTSTKKPVGIRQKS